MEKRSSQRKRVVLSGKVLLSGGGLIDCRVKDLSDGGAKLKVQSIVGLPDSFTLRIESTGKDCLSEIVWRKETEIGVQFV